MSIENILNRIEEEASSAADKLVREAETEVERIGNTYRDAEKDLRKQLEERASKRAEEEERRLIVNEQLELNKLFLGKKREILDELYGFATKKISSLSNDDYAGLIKNMIMRKSLSGSEEIVVPKAHRKIFDAAFLDSLNRAWKGGGRFAIAEEAGNFPWGVILREGKRVVDLTLDVLIAQLKERIEPEIAAILFPHE
jgi:vacuolar-type H+-ATPase subunit E/Vma4